MTETAFETPSGQDVASISTSASADSHAPSQISENPTTSGPQSSTVSEVPAVASGTSGGHTSLSAPQQSTLQEVSACVLWFP